VRSFTGPVFPTGQATTVGHLSSLGQFNDRGRLHIAPSLAGSTHMTMTNAVANTDARKNKVDNHLIANLTAELDRVKADLADELDRVNAETERLRTLNASHRGDQLKPVNAPAIGAARQLIEHLQKSVGQL
jgi:hypothetical protein